METDVMKTVGILGHSLDILNFLKIQKYYRMKAISILEHIWYRGAVLIIKKFKYMRRVD
jgi:hypothetical protein